MDVDTRDNSSSPMSTPPRYSPNSEREYLASAANSTYSSNPPTLTFKNVDGPPKKPRRKKDPENGDDAKKSRPRDPLKPARKRVKTTEGTPLLTAGIAQQTLVSGSVAGRQANPSIATVPAQRPSSSGQRFDPIRSASAENAISLNNSPYGSPARLAPPQATTHARASPSIASLIEPNPPKLDFSSSRPPNTTPPTSAAKELKLHSASTVSQGGSPTLVINGSFPGTANATAKPIVNGEESSRATTAPRMSRPETTANDPSPKPPRQKDTLASIAGGTGLLSKAAFGVTNSGSKEYAEVPNQCIVIEVNMTQETPNYVNFMKEVENKYGFDVAHPRLAEHRRRMKEVAAAGAALESGPGSADEMPIDESDGSSDVEMKGVDEENANVQGNKERTKKRRLKLDYYDKTDDFIDDSEMMWEQNALASKDGYFVWSGPLMPEADKPATDKADGTTSRRGGRGRGRGGASRSEPSGRGRSTTGTTRGGRGAATSTRKPRITKADRARMETEKQERERMAATVTKPSQYPGIVMQQ